MVKNGWSKVDIYSNYWVFMILSEHEFQVVSLFQSKCIVEYKYELYGQKRATIVHIWASSGPKPPIVKCNPQNQIL